MDWTMVKLAVDVSLPQGGCIDTVQIESCGLIRVNGWADPCLFEPSKQLQLLLNGRLVEATCNYRYHRPDVPTSTLAFWGYALEYFSSDDIDEIALLLRSSTSAEKLVYQARIHLACSAPHYESLLKTPEVLCRDHIYGSGPPVSEVSPEVQLLVGQFTGKVLDFGCGKGALVDYLQNRSIAAEGIEIDRPPIRDAIPSHLRRQIRLYEGNLPLPYKDASFDHVTCVEVLEHIHSWRPVLHELARVARTSVLLTVPDMSAIPLLHKHNVVPWHLLESTHVNFFTQQSLGTALRQVFRRVCFSRIGSLEVNGTRFWTSLAAIGEV
jgi:2-polyprenyl-3-methyl-5-hydroxy-6-metoxy-1,4-benzoquinol methylase